MTDKSLKDSQTRKEGWCNQPDRHNPKLRCGYPLPCPHHTAVIDPPDVTFIPPGTSEKIVKRLEKIAKIIDDGIFEATSIDEDIPMGIDTVCPKCKQRPCIC